MAQRNFVADWREKLSLPASYPLFLNLYHPHGVLEYWSPSNLHSRRGTRGLLPSKPSCLGVGYHTALWHVLQDHAEQNSSYCKERNGRSKEDGTHLTGSEAWREHVQTGRHPPGNAWCQGRLKVMSLQIPLLGKTRLLSSIRRSIIRQGKKRTRGSALQSWAVFGWDALLAVSWWLWNASPGPASRRAERKYSWSSHACLFRWALQDALRCTERTCAVTPQSSRRDPWVSNTKSARWWTEERYKPCGRSGR